MDVEIGFEFGVGLSVCLCSLDLRLILAQWQRVQGQYLGAGCICSLQVYKSALEAQSSDGAWSPLSRQPVGESLPVNQPPGGL